MHKAFFFYICTFKICSISTFLLKNNTLKQALTNSDNQYFSKVHDKIQYVIKQKIKLPRKHVEP